MTRTLKGLFRAIEILMAVLLSSMILFMFANVVMRYVFGTGLAWSEEVARLAFIFLVYLGTIGAYKDNQHLGVDTLLEKTPVKVANVLYGLVQVIVIWVMVLLAMGSWALAEQTFNDRWVATQFPRWIVSGAGVLTGVSIAIIALLNLYRLVIRRESVETLTHIHDDNPDDAATAVAMG